MHKGFPSCVHCPSAKKQWVDFFCRAHGHMRGLWKAAQLGLSLRPLDGTAAAAAPAAPHGDSETHAACTCPTNPQALQGAARSALCRKADAAKEATCSETSAPACSQDNNQKAATGTHAAMGAACSSQQTRGGLQQDSSDKRQAPAWGIPGGQLEWEPGGAGPPAAQLLRKLRWVTLGPQFDWSTRVYDAHAPHRPLPPELRALAVTLVSAVADLQLRPPADANHAPRNNIDSHSLATSKGCGKMSQSHTDAAWSCLDSQNWGDWEPDVALVNYYREGDTLGGHKDDAERDMRAPIVALSLGCDAIFLLGGE